MKKIIALMLAILVVASLVACGNTTPSTNAPTNKPTTNPTTAPTQTPTEPADPNGAMSYAEFVATEDGMPVTVEFYVQGFQGWWDGAICLYGQTTEGGYFAYKAACSEEDAAKISVGTKVRVVGEKTTYQSLIEVVNATVEVLTDAEPWIADVTDVTAFLGKEEMAAHMNKKVSLKGMTLAAVEYRNGEPGDDIYVTLSKDGVEYSFCVEVYLTGVETDVYKAFETLQIGDVVDVEGFLYYYADAINPHITAIGAAKSAHQQFVETEDGMPVTVEFYVQGFQGWWDGAICLYGQTAEGGYFAYKAACSEEDAAKISVGTKVRVAGEKTTYQGLIEVVNGTVEVLADAEPWIAEVTDVTAFLGQEEMAAHMNKKVSFKGMTVVKIEYRNGEPGDDIYVTLSKDGVEYSFCVEVYLTGVETDVYKAFATLQAGDVVDVEGFLYYYADAINPHITAITKI